MLPSFFSALLRSFLFRIGVMFSVLALLAYGALTLWIAHEQALTPGEKSLGVAILAMGFAIPLFFGVIGFCSVVLSAGVVGYRKLVVEKSASRSLP
jgi:hypothetical protein